MTPQPRSCLIFVLTTILPAAAAAAPVDFSRDVLPILSDNCSQCHGPDPTSPVFEKIDQTNSP
jgi:mono/diheme cytochrome c family protein